MISGRLFSTARSAAAAGPLRTTAIVRHSSNSVLAWSHLKTFLPRLNYNGSSTLGEVYDGLYAKYKYRLAYPVLLWGLFLYSNLWGSYISPEEKAQIRAHDEKLKSLEFHQV
ncbi:hypothetical protein DFJ73DRAFT_832967 [Zopfochytrium polystomum]|nr:hypothetical protein DFJ73DRAFT_832967 [Zopfochytrium polystomum]